MNKKTKIISIILVLALTISSILLSISVISNDIKPTEDYTPQANSVHQAFYMDIASTTPSSTSRQRYFDGTYLFVAQTDKLSAYNYNSSSKELTMQANISSGGAYGCWGDGTYIYCCRQGALSAYSFNGTAFMLLDTVSGRHYQVECKDDFIFTLGGGFVSASYTHAYTFDGSTFTNVSQWKDTFGGVEISVEKASPTRYYIYGASRSNAKAFTVYVFNGTSFTHQYNYTTWTDDSFVLNHKVFTVNNGHLYSVSFDGSSFTTLDSISTVYPASCGQVWATTSSTGTYVFYGANDVMDCVLFDNSTNNFIEILDRINVTTYDADILGYGNNFSYPHSGVLFCGASMTVVSGFATNFSADTITVAQGKNTSWYNYNTTVPDLENAINNINDGGTIYLWDGTYPNWGWSKWSTTSNTYPRIETNNVTIIGNGTHSFINSDFLIEADQFSINAVWAKFFKDDNQNGSNITSCYSDDGMEFFSSENFTVTGCSLLGATLDDQILIHSNSHDGNISGSVFTSDIGITCTDAWNISIYNNNFYGVSYGIDCDDYQDRTSNIYITHNYIHDASSYGIRLTDTYHSLIHNNRIYNITGRGIRFDDYVTNITISNNYIYNCNQQGLYVDDRTTKAEIRNNQIWNVSCALDLDSLSSKTHVNITDNTLQDCNAGIRLNLTRGALNVSNNYIYDVNYGIIGRYWRNYKWGSPSTFYNNTILSATYGIKGDVFSGKVLIKKNSIQTGTTGINLSTYQDSDDAGANITKNNITLFDTGIWLGAHNSTIYNNTIWNITTAIRTFDGDGDDTIFDVDILENYIYNATTGIQSKLEESMIRNNSIVQCHLGIHLLANSTRLYNNTLYLNDIGILSENK